MDRQIVESYIRAGEIAKQVKKYACEIIKLGVPLLEIARKIDDKIIELGGELGFPVNLSTDEEAAHFTPDSSCERVAKGLLKFDVGIVVDGYFADTAISFDLTENGEHKEMIELNTKILDSVMETIKPGVEVRQIGDAVQDTLEAWNSEHGTSFAVIRGLSGHEIGKNKIHAGLTISNYRNDKRTVLNEKAFAIEPFVTTGAGDIYEGKPGGIYAIKSNENVRDRDARAILKVIREKYKTRPFCARWLERDKLPRIRYALGVLEKQRIIYQYPILIEKSKAPVSQMENTFVISGKEVFITTKN